MNDDNMSKAPEGFTKASFGFNRKIFSNLADKVMRYDWGQEVAPGITAVESSGHTPGHTSFVIASGSGRLFFQGDVTNVPELFLRNPDWQVMFDHEPEKAVQTRRRIYDMVRPRRSLFAAITFRSPDSVISRRPAPVIAWCRRPGVRCSEYDLMGGESRAAID
jgi:glyoxylase-like metal-dependent hydrolase (beta-lactamase superfamily II)